MEITHKIQISTLKVYIDGLLHVSLPKPRFIGLQSWADKKDWYVIEIYLEGQCIKLEYTTREKWEKVLILLDSQLF